jgi:hypothetical protein
LPSCSASGAPFTDLAFDPGHPSVYSNAVLQNTVFQIEAATAWS